MNKPVVTIGGVVVLVGLFLSLIDQTLGWWQVLLTPDIGDPYTIYYSAFGIIYDTSSENFSASQGNLLFLAGIITFSGGLLAIFTSLSEHKAMAFLAAIFAIAGVIMFILVLPSAPEIASLYEGVTDINPIWGTTTVTSLFIFDTILESSLGIGFFVSAIGGPIALVGSFLGKSD